MLVALLALAGLFALSLAGSPADSAADPVSRMALTGSITVGGQAVRLRSHASDRHSLDEVPIERVYAALASQACPKEKYISPARGQVLLLCPIPGTSEWAGMIVVARPKSEPTLEITTWAAPRWRWQEIIARDGYAPIPVVP